MGVSKKKLTAYVGMVLMTIGAIRTLILLFESWAMVREEREADEELIQLCKNGSARSSLKMRSACLQARADKASPVLLKALMVALGTAFGEFKESVSSYYGLMTVCLFILASLVLPMLPWLRAVLSFWSVDEELDEDMESNRHHVVVVGGGSHARKRLGFMRRRQKSQTRMPELEMSPYLGDRVLELT